MPFNGVSPTVSERDKEKIIWNLGTNEVMEWSIGNPLNCWWLFK